jgi:hypothetical protein
MKNVVLIFILGVITGCGNKKNLIAGRYVLSYQNETSRNADTIVITPLNEKAGVYYFVHHIGLQKLTNGNVISQKLRTDSSLCVYSADREQITDQIYGNVYSVTDAEIKLLSEEEGSNVVYKRIQ